MSEPIINALMHLFAIIANVYDDDSFETLSKIVKSYLNQHLNEEASDESLKLFHDYLGLYKRDLAEIRRDESWWDSEPLNVQQISKICIKINKELALEERTILIIQFLELIIHDQKVTTKEDEFINLVAENFKLDQKEFQNIKSFIIDPDIKDIEKERVLLIDNHLREWPEDIAWMMKKKSADDLGYKYYYVENLFGKITVLYISSTQIFIYKYAGPLNLFMEGKRVIPGKAYILNPGSIIKGPNIKPLYRSVIVNKFLFNKHDIKIVYSATNIEYKFKDNKTGIQKFNFSDESGHLVSIMGGSGVGKTTLLNILNGNLKPQTGEIRINGFDLYKHKEKLQGVIGYVPQDDLLFDELTVNENLYFAAKLSFSDFSEKRINENVEKILRDLDLWEVRDMMVGNPLKKFISGGQRKRLNIGLELIREPSILFLDEPTSGLSSFDSEKVINLLKEQAQKGKLVIANIHQPSSDIFKMFDKLIILDKGGYPVYYGNPIDAIIYFKTLMTQVNAAESECPRCGYVNPEQILQIIDSKVIDEYGRLTRERKVKPSEWYSHYLKKIETQLETRKFKSELPWSNFLIPTLLGQFKLFSKRNFKAKLTDKQYLVTNMIIPPLLAFILSYFSKYTEDGIYIFSENKNFPVYIFMSVVVALFLGMSISAEEIFKDKKILKRESFLNLSRLSYLNSKILFVFLLSALQVFVFILVGNLILQVYELNLYYWIILFSVACFANMVGLTLSSSFDSIVTIYILIPFLLVPQLLLGGAMIKFDELHESITSKVHVPLIGNLMASRWGYEALAVTQFKENKYEKPLYDLEKQRSAASYKISYLIPRLSQKIEEAKRHLEDSTEYNYTLIKIRNGISMLDAESNRTSNIETLNRQSLDTARVTALYNHLNDLDNYYNKEYQRINSEYDNLMRERTDSLGREGLFKLKKQYYSNYLADMVLDRNDLIKLYESKTQLVQKKDPVFNYPKSKYGQAHFYAPVKFIGNFEIETIWFNITVIWLMSLVLYIMLIYDVLRKIVDYIGDINIPLINPRDSYS